MRRRRQSSERRKREGGRRCSRLSRSKRSAREGKRKGCVSRLNWNSKSRRGGLRSKTRRIRK
jgi:hypothetical protein